MNNIFPKTEALLVTLHCRYLGRTNIHPNIVFLPIISCYWGLTSIYSQTAAMQNVSGYGKDPTTSTMTKNILTICTAIFCVSTILFGLAFGHRLTMPFNSEENYYDESSATVYHRHSIIVYGIITLVLCVMTILAGITTIKTFRNKMI